MVRDNKIPIKVLVTAMAFLLFLGVFIASYESAFAAVSYGSYTNDQRAAIYYTYTQDKDTCKTKLTVRLRVYAKSNTYSTYKNDASWSLTYDGTTKTGTKDYNCPDKGEYQNISSSYSKTITQTNGAAKSVKLSGWINLSETSIGGKLSVSDTITLPKFQPSTTYSSQTVKGSIVWDDEDNRDGKRPESVTIMLYRNGTQLKSKTVYGESFSWTGLYTYAAGGSKYTYKVQGSDIEGYTMNISGTTITYERIPDKKDIKGKVIWEDENNKNGKRPEEIEVFLKVEGNIVDTIKISSQEEWVYEFKDIYVYENGNPIEYEISATNVPGYYYSKEEYNIKYTTLGQLGVIFGFSI